MSDRLPESELALWLDECRLGVCSDPRREFGRDYRILSLIHEVQMLTDAARTHPHHTNPTEEAPDARA